MRSAGVGDATVALLGAVVLVACAKGFHPEDEGTAGAQAPAPVAAASGGGGGARAGSPAPSGGTVASAPAATPTADGRTPCSQAEVGTCTCDDTGTAGERTCVFDASSPEDGYFGPCGRCAAAPADEADPCADGDKNGLESDTDCGGPDCDTCPAGSTCVVDEDCEASTCMGGTCTAAAAAGSGGAGGAGGSGGSGGAGGSGGSGGAAPSTPVDDCDGYPMGTPCDRFCLGDRISACDDEGDCECMNP